MNDDAASTAAPNRMRSTVSRPGISGQPPRGIDSCPLRPRTSGEALGFRGTVAVFEGLGRCPVGGTSRNGPA